MRYWLMLAFVLFVTVAVVWFADIANDDALMVAAFVITSVALIVFVIFVGVDSFLSRRRPRR